jgi:hypothetical protein
LAPELPKPKLAKIWQLGLDEAWLHAETVAERLGAIMAIATDRFEFASLAVGRHDSLTEAGVGSLARPSIGKTRQEIRSEEGDFKRSRGTQIGHRPEHAVHSHAWL